MKSTKYLITIVLLTIFTTVNAGGGWTQGKGKGFFLLNQRYIGGSFYANNLGQILDLENDWAGVFTTHFYGELGITNKLDVIAHSQLFIASFYHDKFPNSFTTETSLLSNIKNMGLGDLDLAVKYNLFSKGPQISATLLFGLPTGKYKPGVFGHSHTLTSDGEFNQMLKLDMSNGFGNNFFYTGFVGINNRTNAFSDELHLGGEIGKNGKKLVSILKVYFLKSFENGAATEATVPGIYSNNLEYLSISPCFLYKLSEKSGLMLDIGVAPYLRNIIAAPSFSFGFWLKR